MKRFIKTIIFVLISATFAHAQQGQGMARIHAAKMAYITDRLRLSPEQSSNFIPLYNEYEHEVRGIRQSFMGKYRGAHPQDTDDISARRYIDDNLDYQQAVIDLKRRYNDRFLKVISSRQLADLYNAEREFRQILLRRLNHGAGPGQGRGKSY